MWLPGSTGLTPMLVINDHPIHSFLNWIIFSLVFCVSSGCLGLAWFGIFFCSILDCASFIMELQRPLSVALEGLWLALSNSPKLVANFGDFLFHSMHVVCVVLLLSHQCCGPLLQKRWGSGRLGDRANRGAAQPVRQGVIRILYCLQSLSVNLNKFRSRGFNFCFFEECTTIECT